MHPCLSGGLAAEAQGYKSRAGGCGEISSKDICGETPVGNGLAGASPVLMAMLLVLLVEKAPGNAFTCFSSSWKITTACSNCVLHKEECQSHSSQLIYLY